MLAIIAALAAHAQGREPTEDQLRESTVQFRRVFAEASPRRGGGKVWEGTQHILGPNLEHLGYIVTLQGSTDDIRVERWVTWGGVSYTFPGWRFALIQQENDLTWDTAVALVGTKPAPYSYTEMTVEYKTLTEEEVQAMAGQFVSGTKTLYTVIQGGLETCPPTCELAWSGDIDGWLLRVDPGDGSWQDHWTFKASFEIDEIGGVYPRVYVEPMSTVGIVEYSAIDYYKYAADHGAVTWSFVEHTEQIAQTTAELP